MKALLICLLVTLVGNPSWAADNAEPRLKLLIVDGMNNHDWPRATKILKEILQGSGRFTVEVSTSPTADASKDAWERWRPDFKKYGVVLSNFNGGHTPTGTQWPKEVEKALEDYVAGGGGLVVYHSANNSFPNWPAYNEMIGLGWRDKSFGPSLIVSPEEKIFEIPKGEGRNPGHGPEHDFQVTVLNTDHPITRGMPKKWMHPHEQLTHGQHGPAKNMAVLTYAYSKDTKDNEPMEWVIPYGRGRVYTTMLGHLWKNGPDTAMRCVGFQTMLIRGCEWAATGRVTCPVPKDFPSATEIRLSQPSTAFNITTKKPEDRITVTLERDTATLDLLSPSRIGSGTLTLANGKWPTRVIIRFHLGGLESFAVSNGKITPNGAVLSHSGNPKHLYFTGDGKEGKREPETEIKVLDTAGKPIKGLPGKGGCFEITLPKALLEGPPKSLELGWIDCYRG
ncbi:MAG: ThuA domain-containing protein [Thermoguttaceae bacterium]|jgi:type 1 glutamine amidotransferase